MSMELMVKAMKTKVGNPLRKLVLVKLADNASDQGECWPSYQHIADQCEIGRSTVKLHVRELEKAGFLRREYRRKGELNQSNLFHLSLDGGSPSALPSGAPDNPPGAGDNLGGGAGAAPRTSHSSEPVNEPKPMCNTGTVKGFDQFWKMYPRKVGKDKASKAWQKLQMTEALYDLIVSALTKHVATPGWTKDNGQFIPHAATWLNGKRWEDEVVPAGRTGSGSRHTQLDQVDHTDGLELDANGNFRIAGDGQ
ncbi:helix-turn-helix domain-containing protein [Pseudomonas syringae]|uniref:helix-turn-helix domain-containing protein n=1 Tax=Pseudomonas syringae TaxID=317 RepID=UPI0018E5B6A9|nr:helix-turn-helix domain-containing protein [Pseudomonas syringae]MBI6743307.1 helix-turn-helix domain-containing protein [Pseudomonas syringae]MBI6762297.1 helix-turn-helix domain-containing protein [Pseudomonas syringae]MBI6828189.1 helix-turn-helix domain-containing protein [Pseudomonas syringae]